MVVAQALAKLLTFGEVTMSANALAAVAAITATLEQRVYPGKFPQDVGGDYKYPGIVFRKATEDRSRFRRLNPDEEQEAPNAGNLQENEWLIFCVGLEPTYSVQAKLSELVRIAIGGFQGLVTDDTVSPPEQILIQGIFPGRSYDFYDDKTQTFQVVCAYDVFASGQ